MATGRSTGKGKTVRYVDQSNSKGSLLQPPITKNVSISSFFITCEWMLMLYEQKQQQQQQPNCYDRPCARSVRKTDHCSWNSLYIVNESENEYLQQHPHPTPKKGLQLRPLTKRWGGGWGGVGGGGGGGREIHQTSSTVDKACGEHKPKLNTTIKMGTQSCYQHRKIIMSIFIQTMCL